MVQSAFKMNIERMDGTLEVIFLTPANRLSILYGRSLSGIASNVWMFAVFTVVVIAMNMEISLRTLILMLVAFIMVVLSAIIWGD